MKIRGNVEFNILLWLVLTASSGVQVPGQNPEQPERIGSEICQACHDLEPAFFQTTHADTDCESCHGPGSDHVGAGGDMSLSLTGKDPGRAISQCSSCHQAGAELSGFRHSPHGRNNIACVSCHRVHPEEVNFGLLQMSEEKLCASCHQTVAAEFRKPFHHRVLEGAMKCSDCHSPHNEEYRPLRFLAVGTSRNCVSCHSEKRGPFVFEHAPLKANDCQTCHQPHGSINTRMLRRTQVHQLCLECHSMTPFVAGPQPPAFHDLRSPRFQNCTICHREIHGSNVSSRFLK